MLILILTNVLKVESGDHGKQLIIQVIKHLRIVFKEIEIDHVSDWVVEFPADISIDCGTTVPDFGEPEIFFETCEMIAVSYEDVVYNSVPGACYKIVRNWEVINWCVVGSNIDQEVIEKPENELGLSFPACDLDKMETVTIGLLGIVGTMYTCRMRMRLLNQ